MRNGEIEYSDYYCFPPKPDHHYSERRKEDEVLKLKIRVSPNSERWFLKVNFDEGFSQIWSKPDDETSRIRINHCFQPDVSDLEALQKKLKMYITFS